MAWKNPAYPKQTMRIVRDPKYGLGVDDGKSMITIHLCDECRQPLEEVVGFYRCTNPECDMYDELVDEDD